MAWIQMDTFETVPVGGPYAHHRQKPPGPGDHPECSRSREPKVNAFNTTFRRWIAHAASEAGALADSVRITSSNTSCTPAVAPTERSVDEAATESGWDIGRTNIGRGLRRPGRSQGNVTVFGSYVAVHTISRRMFVRILYTTMPDTIVATPSASYLQNKSESIRLRVRCEGKMCLACRNGEGNRTMHTAQRRTSGASSPRRSTKSLA